MGQQVDIAPALGAGLPPRARIKRRADFLRAQRHGARVHTPHFTVLLRPSTGELRVGVTVTKKTCPRAVDRNRIKRLVRDVFRRNRQLFPGSCDVVVIGKRGAQQLSAQDVRSEFARAGRAMAAAARKAEGRGAATCDG